MKPINPHLLDVVKRDGGYTLFYAGRPLLTPQGSEIIHHEPRLLEHILRELSLSRALDERGLDSYALFAAKDHACGDDCSRALPGILRADPVVKRRTMCPDESPDEPASLSSIIDEDDCMAFYFAGMAGALGCLDEFLVEHGTIGLAMIGDSFDKFEALIVSAVAKLPAEKRAVLLSLCAAHEAGILLPLLLITRKLTASEYANALFSIHLPLPESYSRPQSFSELLVPSLRKTHLLPDWKTPEVSFARLRDQAASVMEYLSCCEHADKKSGGLRELICMGEHFGLEFKSCLRWNLRSGQKDVAIEHASLKTVAAFLNSSGGTLLVGVRDDGSIEGIETDGFPDEDRFSLHFWNLAKSRFGQEACPFISTAFEKIDGKTVFAVVCARSPSPVFLNQKQGEDEFYIRVGPSSSRLTIREALKYIANRFEKKDDADGGGQG